MMNNYQTIAVIVALGILAWMLLITTKSASEPVKSPHPSIPQWTWDRWSALSNGDRVAFRKLITGQPVCRGEERRWDALSINDQVAFRTLILGGQMFSTPPDVSRCERLRLTGPTPCRFPHCKCDMGDRDAI